MKRILFVLIGSLLFLCLYPHGIALAGHPCPICKVDYSSRAQLREHMAIDHPDAKDRPGNLKAVFGHMCPRCGKYFQSRAQGIRHEAECSAPMPKDPKEKGGGTAPGTDSGTKPPARTGPGTKAGGDGWVSDKAGGDPKSVGAMVPRPIARPGQVTVVLTTGDKFVGTVEARSASTITLKTPEGAEVSFPMERVKEVIETIPSREGEPSSK
ncbi:MAG: C2H2-type zinc finger protein [Planctomycetota bacterium]